MLVPLQEQLKTSSIESDTSSTNSSDSSTTDIVDSDIDEEGSSEEEQTVYHASQHAYSIRDSIPVDLRSYSYACNSILDRNTSKMQKMIVWA